MSEEQEREAENAQISAVSERPRYDQELLAHMLIQEGKPFRTSALAAGYSQTVAARGLKAFIAESPKFADVMRRKSEGLITLDRLKPLAVQRLHAEITNPKSSLGIKAIEIAGRFKETDWFVRNAEVNIGVFAGLAEPDAIDVQTYEDNAPEKP